VENRRCNGDANRWARGLAGNVGGARQPHLAAPASLP